MNNKSVLSTLLNAAIDVACSASPRDTGGPVVKTGPTAEKNRSRNKDGT